MNYKTSNYSLGDLVYLHAYNPKNKDISFLCRGFIARQPTKQSPVYKIVVVSICCKTLTNGNQADLAGNLLNLRIPCPPNNINKTLGNSWSVFYKDAAWISLSATEQNSIYKKILETN